MKGFFNYCRRYTKSRFFKFLLFFIVFCIISLVKSCDVHAWSGMSINAGESYVTYQIGELDRYGLTDLYTARKFEMKYKQNGNDKPAFDFHTLTYYNIMNITFEYKLATTWINNNNQYKYISFNFNNFLDDNVKFQLFDSATTIEQASSWFNFYNFVPFSAEYHDPTTDTWVSVDLRLYSWNTSVDFAGHLQYIMTMPTGASFDGLKLRFGDLHDLQVSEIYLNSKMYPSENGSEPYMYYQYGYNYSYSTYKAFNQDDYDYLGLLVFPANTSLDNFNYRPSSNISTNNEFTRISYNGSLPSSATLDKVWNFAGMDYIEYEEQIQQENQEKLDEVLEQIAQEEELEKYNNDLSNSMSSFINSDNSTAFTGLFSSLFLYPLQKLNSIKNEDLYMTNAGGGHYNNLGLCVGVNGIGQFNNRWRIHITDSDYFEMPCPHYDIYPKLHTANYHFMGSVNENINGTVTDPNSFQFYYQIVIRGLLVYFLFVTCLNIYKYILDINDTKVEVLEL